MINQRWVPPLGRAPNSPFILNSESPQAEGLLAWWPTLASRGGFLLREFVAKQIQDIPTDGIAWVNHPDMGFALDFSSQTTSITISPIDFLQPAFAQGAIALWATGNGTTQNHHLFMIGHIFSNTIAIKETTGKKWRFEYDTNTEETVLGLVDVVVDALYHLVATWSAGGIEFFIDGVSVGTSSRPDVIVPTEGRIGGISNPSFDHAKLIGDMRVYNRRLTANDVHRLYYNPWDLYKPLRGSLLAFVAAVGGMPYPGRNHPSRNVSLRL